jgi:hypothetical protein
MEVHIVMGNDFPERVYRDKDAAVRFCAEKMAEQRTGLKPHESPRIYWLIYSFELLGPELREAAKRAVGL